MKRTLFMILVIFWIFPVFVNAEQKHPKNTDEIKALMNSKELTTPTADMVPIGKFSVEVKDIGNMVHITILNPAMVSVENLSKSAAKVRLASGILHAAGKTNFYFANLTVKKGKISFTLPNYAKGLGEPVVEHIWGYTEAVDGDVGFFLLDPADKWISYETDSDTGSNLVLMDTLAIGLVMYPGKPTVPLKSLNKGKLNQGRHPELAE